MRPCICTVGVILGRSQLWPSLLRPVHFVVSSGLSIMRRLDPSASNVIRLRTAMEPDLGKNGYLGYDYVYL